MIGPPPPTAKPKPKPKPNRQRLRRCPPRSFPVVRAEVSYSLRDALLFAVAVGYGASGSSGADSNGQPEQERDLRYVYEGHPQVGIAPSFCLTLLFGATLLDLDPKLEMEKEEEEEEEEDDHRPKHQHQHQHRPSSSFERLGPFPPPVLQRLLGGLMLEDQATPRGSSSPWGPRHRGSSSASLLSSITILHTHQSIQWDPSAPLGVPHARGGLETAQVLSWIESVQVRPRRRGSDRDHDCDRYGEEPRGKERDRMRPPSPSPVDDLLESAAALGNARSWSGAKSSKSRGIASVETATTTTIAVTTQTVIRQCRRVVCEMKSTFLLVGLRLSNGGEQKRQWEQLLEPAELTAPAGAPGAPSSPPALRAPVPPPTASLPMPPSWQKSFELGRNSALLYRLASGDTNRLHVLASLPEEEQATPRRRPPVIHGLCTLGHVARILTEHYDGQSAEEGRRSVEAPAPANSSEDSGRCCATPASPGRSKQRRYAELESLDCRFASPVFAGDSLLVQAWEGPSGSNNDDSVPFTTPTSPSSLSSSLPPLPIAVPGVPAESVTSAASSACPPLDLLSPSSQWSSVTVTFVVRDRSTGAVALDRGCAVLRVPTTTVAASIPGDSMEPAWGPTRRSSGTPSISPSSSNLPRRRQATVMSRL